MGVSVNVRVPEGSNVLVSEGIIVLANVGVGVAFGNWVPVRVKVALGI